VQMLDGVRRNPLPVTIGDLDVFGGDRPRALIAKVQPTPELTELQAEHERIMRRAGLAAETRKFTPHVTLARLRSVTARAVADWLAQQSGPVRAAYEARRFVLYSARASTGGGPYVLEDAWPLGFSDGEDDDEAEW